jgi:hypothetical protein
MVYFPWSILFMIRMPARLLILTQDMYKITGIMSVVWQGARGRNGASYWPRLLFLSDQPDTGFQKESFQPADFGNILKTEFFNQNTRSKNTNIDPFTWQIPLDRLYL